jgi:hypothetical protein
MEENMIGGVIMMREERVELLRKVKRRDLCTSECVVKDSIWRISKGGVMKKNVEWVKE